MKMKKGVILGMVGVLIGTAGAYATLNIDTTINNLYSYVNYLFVTSDGTANGTTTIKLDGTNGRIDAKSVYVNGKALATEKYVNTKASQTLSSAKSYANTKASDTLNVAKAYADTKKTEAVNEAKNYTDNHVVDGAHIANGSITKNKLDSDLQSLVNNNFVRKQICVAYHRHCVFRGFFGCYRYRNICDRYETIYELRNGIVTSNSLGNSAVTSDKIANGSVTIDKLSNDLKNKIFNPVPIAGRCSGNGLIGTVPDWNMDDSGPHGEGDSLRIYCVDGVRICCLSHEYCYPAQKKARSNGNGGWIAKTWGSSGNYTYRNYRLHDGTVYCTK